MGLPLEGYKVLLSSSVPEDLEGQVCSQNHFSLLTSLIGGILQAGGLLIFGGHPSITQLVHKVGRMAGAGGILLYQSMNFYSARPQGGGRHRGLQARRVDSRPRGRGRELA